MTNLELKSLCDAIAIIRTAKTKALDMPDSVYSKLFKAESYLDKQVREMI